MSDKIAEIRARHEEGIRAGADEDRAYLLAEVDRLRAFEAAHKQLQAALDVATRERDEAWSKETDYGEGFEEGWAAAQKHAAAEVERLQGLLEDISRDMVEAVVRLTRERDEARAEVERLRKEMLEVAEELENEEPRSHKNIAFGIRNAVEAKP